MTIYVLLLVTNLSLGSVQSVSHYGTLAECQAVAALVLSRHRPRHGWDSEEVLVPSVVECHAVQVGVER